MKKNIHPYYGLITVTCDCGNKMQIYTTANKKLNIEICYLCHPFYTGHVKTNETKGRIDQFQKKYSLKNNKNQLIFFK